MSVNEERAKIVFNVVNECLDVTKELKLVTSKPAAFFRRFETRISNSEMAFGGCKSDGIPFVKMSTHCRDHDKNSWLPILKSMAWEKQKSWKKAIDYAFDDKWMYIEYSRIFLDKEIGSFVSDNPLDHVRATAAHEVAHAIHWWHINVCNHKKTPTHGCDWRFIYRQLRKHWVNPLLEDGMNLE